MYMEGTKFELRHFDNPDHMHRVAMLSLGIGLSWHSEGDAQRDPERYTESFDVIDSLHPENNREGLTRQQCEQFIFDLYWEEQCR